MLLFFRPFPNGGSEYANKLLKATTLVPGSMLRISSACPVSWRCSIFWLLEVVPATFAFEPLGVLLWLLLSWRGSWLQAQDLKDIFAHFYKSKSNSLCMLESFHSFIACLSSTLNPYLGLQHFLNKLLMQIIIRQETFSCCHCNILSSQWPVLIVPPLGAIKFILRHNFLESKSLPMADAWDSFQ